MATVEQRLSYSGDNINFPRLVDSIEMGDYDHIIHHDKNGGTIIYTRSTQKEWPVDVICTEAEADTKIRSWIENRYQLVFTPNQTAAPGTTHNCRITNKTFPMRLWGSGKWRGTLRLRKE